jgi:hypothetical protein
MNRCDLAYDRYMLCGNPDKWGNTGAVRRARRQINRAWAVKGRDAFGVNSIYAYCRYINTFGYLVGDTLHVGPLTT